MLLCNRKSQYEKRDYEILDASHGFASIALRNPATTEDPGAFDVPQHEIINVRRVIYVDGLPVEVEPIKNIYTFSAEAEDAFCLAHPGAMM
jgi:hypothetical protein